MSLRTKVVLILSVIVVLYAGLDHIVQRVVLLRSFAALEEVEARKDVERVVEAFEKEIESLDARCLDWASREDTLQYIAEKGEDYERTYLGLESLRAHELNLLFYLGADGMAVWSRILELDSGEDLSLTHTLPKGGLLPPQLRDGAYAGGHPLLRRALGQEKTGLCGLYLTERSPMLISSRPIIADGMQGDVNGWLIMGRFVNEDLLDLIRERTAVAFVLEEAPQGGLDEHLGERWNRVTGAPIDPATGRPVPVIEPEDDVNLLGFAAIEDVKQAPGVMIRANVPRDITRKGMTAVQYALLSTVAAGMLMMLVLMVVLGRTVLTPIAALTQHAVHIGTTDDFSVKLSLDRKDELGVLSHEFDDMMEKLAQSRRALAEHARAAGMSEIATGVLHNVGNALNSVNVSSSLVADKVRTLSSQDLARTMELIEKSSNDLVDFVTNNPKGKHLEPLLKNLSEQLSAQREDLSKEIHSMNEGLDHIKVLVQSQQTYAKGKTLLESTTSERLITTALGFCGAMLHEPDEVEVVREIELTESIEVDRHRTTEIFVNLIQNACQAMRESGVTPPRIVIRAVGAQDGRVRFEVSDCGPGISEENIAKVFNHGFTTKPSGHGFGLHASANAATEMGGTLTARSEGEGRGATFTLEIPMRGSRETAATPT
jgi:sensor domain CHASE-containing protein